ncbi:uncharacterized protein YALI1_C30910g [Yarrowia lipolytica]|uniref:Uncharacterized protein n=1 Tax=Yarrowia lipolytica TaxID=4952 RepID=A0A1D8NCB7_YARLL|nr:hypothetical protein YALI1_C30910g [Yarrowia lipolytica]
MMVPRCTDCRQDSGTCQLVEISSRVGTSILIHSSLYPRRESQKCISLRTLFIEGSKMLHNLSIGEIQTVTVQLVQCKSFAQ